MRFRHPDGSTVHLAYCTNVHPAETLDGVLAQLRDHCEPVRRRLGRDRLGIGLWLAREAAHALVSDPSALRRLRTELDRRGLEVVTLNGFPYEGFGAEEVKYRVYKPDWADPERLAHTTDLARVLAGLLPDDVTEGSVSTLPLAWRTAHDEKRAVTALTALGTLAQRLDALAELTGRSIRVGLEPEPGCTVETTADAIAPLTAIGHDRIGICVDTCHLATSFEDPHTALDALAQAGVPVVKSQLSAALHAEHPHLPDVREALAAFDEPRFLHQTRTATAAGLRGTDDLGEALGGDALPDASPWRAHFHVPLHAAPAAPLTSTLPVLKSALTRLVGGPHPLTRHLEVETYTWQALPPELRPRARAQLADGIAAELTLARNLLTDLGLKELP
ncbi:metabolite traffic protein EboE [Streptomyces turgidiscabies]|uniref:AP endonuclease, family 2 n=2 Tax=Streptomyces TaxID=1883 RepID=L7FIZ9_STRT8|nr:metabolite traffic protein EboE [Streptomyces turgidiscabies]ELP70665.1 AP endonuclease, family 2 [Streptomyces turgidiscabies Car8]MDX3491281.1 metabolite traffic protein EboE [Streptomyces turgidiscabies]GAQ73134.1 xylose isomerase-like TIM barrel [Streptomyces turgidiscabies]